MPIFEVFLGKKAEKALRALDSKLRERIENCIRELEYAPVPARDYDVAKIKGSLATYRIRVQKIRIIYDVAWDAKRIDILVIEKKKDRTYKRSL